MKERPILFSGPMVRALLDGSKTQTRRVLKQATGPSLSVDMAEGAPGVAELSWLWGDGPGHDVHETIKRVPCPYGAPGDRLWVRESFSGPHHRERTPPRDWHSLDEIHCWADGNPEAGDWTKPRPGMFMPRWASRITLEVVSVRVERLQAISEADAMAEGSRSWAQEQDTPVKDIPAGETRLIFRQLWEQINGSDSWDANPWVWAVEFRRLP